MQICATSNCLAETVISEIFTVRRYVTLSPNNWYKIVEITAPEENKIVTLDLCDIIDLRVSGPSYLWAEGNTKFQIKADGKEVYYYNQVNERNRYRSPQLHIQNHWDLYADKVQIYMWSDWKEYGWDNDEYPKPWDVLVSYNYDVRFKARYADVITSEILSASLEALNKINNVKASADGAKTSADLAYNKANTAATNASNAYNKATNNYNILANGTKGLYKVYDEVILAKNATNNANTKVNSIYNEIGNLKAEVNNINNNIKQMASPTINKVSGQNGATCTTSDSFTVVIEADNADEYCAGVDGVFTKWGPSNLVQVNINETGAKMIEVRVRNLDNSEKIAKTYLNVFRI